IDRIAVDTPYYSGKHKRHGMNVQVLTDPFGRLLWASAALPGSTHDLTAARSHRIVDALAAAGLKCWADKAYQGAGRHIRVPFR
ncbi:transposase family protein, partial [Streptomyces lavendulae]